MLTHRDILGVSLSADQNDIKKAYMRLAKIFHPDAASKWAPPEQLKHCEEIFKKIAEAYEVLQGKIVSPLVPMDSTTEHIFREQWKTLQACYQVWKLTHSSTEFIHDLHVQIYNVTQRIRINDAPQTVWTDLNNELIYTVKDDGAVAITVNLEKNNKKLLAVLRDDLVKAYDVMLSCRLGKFSLYVSMMPGLILTTSVLEMIAELNPVTLVKTPDKPQTTQRNPQAFFGMAPPMQTNTSQKMQEESVKKRTTPVFASNEINTTFTDANNELFYKVQKDGSVFITMNPQKNNIRSLELLKNAFHRKYKIDLTIRIKGGRCLHISGPSRFRSTPTSMLELIAALDIFKPLDVDNVTTKKNVKNIFFSADDFVKTDMQEPPQKRKAPTPVQVDKNEIMKKRRIEKQENRQQAKERIHQQKKIWLEQCEQANQQSTCTHFYKPKDSEFKAHDLLPQKPSFGGRNN